MVGISDNVFDGQGSLGMIGRDCNGFQNVPWDGPSE